MNDYNKNSFYSEIDEVTGERIFFIKVKSKKIKVSKEVYYVCYNSYRKQLRDNRRDQEYNLISYDTAHYGQNNLLAVLGEDVDYINTMYKEELVICILEIIENLDAKDKELITELLIIGKKERELAEKYKIAQQSISRKKHRIIKKIKKCLKNKV